MLVRLRTLNALFGAVLCFFPLSNSTAQVTSLPLVGTNQSTSEAKSIARPPLPYLRLSKRLIGPTDKSKDVAGGGSKQTFFTKGRAVVTKKLSVSTTATRTSGKTASVSSVTQVQPSMLAVVSGDGASQPAPEPTVAVKIVARQITCNGGPQMPAKLSYVLGNSPAVPLFDGANVEEGMQTSFTLPVGGEAQPLRFVATFQQTGACPRREVSSDDPNKALNIVHGTDVPAEIADKQINLNYDGQRSLLYYLVPKYVDGESGLGILPENQDVIAFEYMERGSGVTFDMQDLMVEVTTPGPQSSDVWVHEAIGNPADSDGLLGVPMHTFPNQSAYFIPATEFSVIDPGYLSQVRFIGYDFGVVNTANWSFTVSVWSNLEVARGVNQRRIGDLANITLPCPVRELWGYAPDSGPTYNVLLDLSSLGLWLTPGNNYALGVTLNTYPGIDGTMNMSTTSISGPSDYLITSSGIYPPPGSTNRLAIAISETVAGGGMVEAKSMQNPLMSSTEKSSTAPSGATDKVNN